MAYTFLQGARAGDRRLARRGRPAGSWRRRLLAKAGGKLVAARRRGRDRRPRLRGPHGRHAQDGAVGQDPPEGHRRSTSARDDRARSPEIVAAREDHRLERPDGRVRDRRRSAEGTLAIAEALADATAAGAITVVGGGDSVAAIAEERRRRQGHPRLDRRRRVARVPRGQEAARRRGAGELADDGHAVDATPTRRCYRRQLEDEHRPAPRRVALAAACARRARPSYATSTSSSRPPFTLDEIARRLDGTPSRSARRTASEEDRAPSPARSARHARATSAART